MSSSPTYVWSEHRDRLIEATGDAPSAEIEQRIVDVFEKHPSLVVAGVEHIVGRFERGLVRAPWVVLAMHVEEAAAASLRASVPVRDERDRDRARSRASQWMRTAGMHFDREDEIRDELFGDSGMLRQFADDTELVDELLALWATVRPVGVQLEAEAVERGERFQVFSARMHEKPAAQSQLDETVEAGVDRSRPAVDAPPSTRRQPSDDEIEQMLSGSLSGRE
jgi:hypothetical protein